MAARSDVGTAALGRPGRAHLGRRLSPVVLSTSSRPNPQTPRASRPQSPEWPPRSRQTANPAADKPLPRAPPRAPSRPPETSGKSEPTSAAMRSLSAPGNFFFSARSSASSVATAFPEPAPRPPCTGNRLSMVMVTRPRARAQPWHAPRCDSRCWTDLWERADLRTESQCRSRARPAPE